MRFEKFGDKNNPVLFLIHGGFVSWKMWFPQINAFSKTYYVVVPVLDGHDEESDASFHSIEKVADKLIRYIETHHKARIFALCGVSLGGAIAVHILGQKRIMVEKAIIDGAPVAKTNRILYLTTTLLIRRLLKKMRGGENIYRKKFSFYPDEIADHALHICRRMSDETVKNVQLACHNHSIPQVLDINTKLAYWYGSKEAFVCKRMAKQMAKAVKDTRVEIFQGYGHAELCIGNPDLHIERARAFFKTSS
ncbi:alpha/beta hydrolase [Salipaludibacillus sp. LMS25]|jgi:pimeloyl-ACP methyl ester carboxylesterase|uniref:alpha/beta fold hydrolase n=1 Tax=Salipaludibacillus sp. LMS25 TaxID=2924031 RepID=UPI0020D196A6|nr:alpha/beta hydrolase [Salipaludibacillus sp. LMS25]UTR15889.1 alpha/beta hydrolase [Salipaludibacillus sp. LMS25]